jgi:cytochrome P450 family 135
MPDHVFAACCESMLVLPPGPSAPPALQTSRWLFRPIAFMESCRRRYGDAFSIHFTGFRTPLVMVSDPEAVRAVYGEQANELPPGRTATLRPLLGPRSLLLLEGSEHLARRRVMLPPFHGERMRSYETAIAKVAGAEIDSWPLEREFPIHPRMQAVTLEVILRVVFGVTDPARMTRLRSLVRGMLQGTASPALQVFALLADRIGSKGPMRRFEELVEEVDEELFTLIRERRADPEMEGRDDILSALMSARFKDGTAMSDAELRDQLMTLLIAGHETTATALAWTFDLLLRHPVALERLRAEIDAGGEEYMRATIAESLRLRPVVPIAGRRLAAELRVDGYTLPAGTDVTPAVWLTHTRPDVYPDPYAFRPERFLDEAPDTYAWIPFGGGVRRCLGAPFAEFELRVVLREVLGRCELRATRRRPERIGRRNVTFSPRRGTPVLVSERRPAADPVPA